MNLLVLIAIVVLVAAGIVAILVASWNLGRNSPSDSYWPRNRKLVRWPDGTSWTVNDAAQGLLISGSTGSGKSSAPYQLLRSYLRSGFGGIILIAKNDATAEAVEMARSEGRADDVIVVSPDVPGQGFNFLKYEAQKSGADKAITENLVQLLMQPVEVCARQNRSRDGFFEDASKVDLRHDLTGVINAVGEPRLDLVLEMIQSRPATLGDVEEPQRFRALQLLAEAEKRVTPERAYELEMARRYLTSEWPSLSDRTRSSIALTLAVPLDAFLRYPLRQMFLDKLTVSPDDALAGRILIIDVPVKRYDLVGKISGVIWKYSVQRAIERRPELTNGLPLELVRPVFIAADEAQFWATHNDAHFQMTARSARGLTVYATQSIPNFYAEMGGDATSKAKVDSLLANLQTRIACQNLDHTTNQWHAESLGKILVKRQSRSVTVNPKGGGLLAKLAGADRSVNVGESEQLDYDLNPRLFAGLKTGGVENKGIVETIVVSAGKRFRSGRRWLRVSFDQFNLPEGWRKFFTRHAVITIPRKKG